MVSDKACFSWWAGWFIPWDKNTIFVHRGFLSGLRSFSDNNKSIGGIISDLSVALLIPTSART